MKFSLSPFFKKRRNALIAGSVAVLLVVLFIVGVGGGTTSLATYKAMRGEFVIDISTTGELQAKNSVSISVPQRVWGNLRIVQLVVDGTIVKEGDFLLQFDSSEFDNRLLDRQQNLENQKAEFASTKASMESNMKQLETSYMNQQYSYEQAKLRFELMKYEAEAIRRNQELEFKKSELSLQQAKERIESQKIIDEVNTSRAELRVKQAERQVQDTIDMIGALTLTAPKGGMVVLQKMRTPTGFEKIKAGDTPHRGMELIAIPDLSVMLVKTWVNEIDIGRVAEGQQVVVTIDALEGPTFYGKVTSVATLARAEEGSDMKVFDVEVTIEGSDERLKPGMTAQCRIITENIPNVMYLPLESVFQKEDTTLVYVKGHGYDERLVKLGKKNADYVIIDDGISEGEEVALRDPTLPLEELGAGTAEKKGNGSSGRSGSAPL